MEPSPATVRDLIRAFLSDYLWLTEPDWARALDFASLSFSRDDGEPGIAAEPLAWALSALMQPTRRSRAAHQRACLERIHAASLDDARRRLLLGCVEANLQG